MVQTVFLSAKGPEAADLRRRKYALVRRFGLPENILPGSLIRVDRCCGKPTCRCVSGRGHPQWRLEYSLNGAKQVLSLPRELADALLPPLTQGAEIREATAEVLHINAQLLRLWLLQKRAEERAKRGRAKATVA